MEKRRRPIIFHGGFDDWYRHWVPASSFTKILESYPRLPVVIAHMLFPAFDEAFRMLSRFPQLTMDITNVFGALRVGAKARGKDLPEAAMLREGIEQWSERIMLGTDHPDGMGSVENILQDFTEFGLSTEAEENLLQGAAERFIACYLPEYE